MKNRTEEQSFGEEGKRSIWRTMGGYGISLALFLTVLALTGAGTAFFAQKSKENGAETLKTSIRRACVQCYAIEGRYPPSAEYLEENYGIQIDRKTYSVFYSGFASNVMPDITVVELEQEQ